MKNLLSMLVIPSLLLAYVLTGIEGLYVIFSILIVLIFLITLVAAWGWVMGRENMSDEQRYILRLRMQKKVGTRSISLVLAAGLVISLFVLGKYVIGIFYLMSIIVSWSMVMSMRSG